jgi:ubiquinone/menaquinone biosynthesis C-methylase UbiE
MDQGLARQYVKLCDRRDFDDPMLLATIGSILPERDAATHIERKVWEFAQLAMLMDEAGLLTEDTQALSVGAGDERILFWLANRVGRMVATDIYGEGEFAGNEAEASMLTDPAAHAPFPYREDHLEVLWMDGRALEFPDSSFDVVFTLSSIEHFGLREDIAASAREIGRVLKPGGYAVVVTDCLVRLHPFDTAKFEFGVRIATLGRKQRGASPWRRSVLAEAFTPRELTAQIVEPSGLELVQPLDTTLTPSSWENITTVTPDGRVITSSGSPYPAILVRVGRSLLTSVCLVLRKPARP